MALTSPAHATTSPEADELFAKSVNGPRRGLNYGGDLEPEDAYDYLTRHPALLVDVRTMPEWQFVGVPDLAATHGKLATISWRHYPDFAPNKEFSYELGAIAGITKDSVLFFICRSGGRSLDAAVAMTAAGYRYCFNIAGGFEGEPDGHAHRGILQGWKAKKLPWKQG